MHNGSISLERAVTVHIVGASPGLASALKRKLDLRPCHCVVDSFDGESGASLEFTSADLVIVDASCHPSAERLIAKLRATPHTQNVPVIMVVGAGDERLMLRAFEYGADDILTLPLRGGEISARAKALLHGLHRGGRRTASGLDIDLQNHCLRLNGSIYALGPAICRILMLFTSHPGSVLSRTLISAALGGTSSSPIDARSIDVYVGRLRRVLAEAGQGHCITTVRGRGYRYDPGSTAQSCAQ
ncbi:MAG: response regulator transcription factor [Hyphomicrobiaceae bacterium]|nr:response regulator transcription factor [Hyphomicrobiaceae bacterium]